MNTQNPIQAKIKDGKIFFDHLENGVSLDGINQIADSNPSELAKYVDDVILSISRTSCHIINNLSDEDMTAMRGHLPTPESIQFLGILSESLKKM
jgi:hypothetical protein